jgi:hypothetical protein
MTTNIKHEQWLVRHSIDRLGIRPLVDDGDIDGVRQHIQNAPPETHMDVISLSHVDVAAVPDLEWVVRLAKDLAAPMIRERKTARTAERKSNLAEAIAWARAKRNSKSLRALKCGRDEYSRLSLARLRELMSADNMAAAEAAWPNATDEERASVYRWMLRGLDAELAARKVRLTISIGIAASGSLEVLARRDPVAAEARMMAELRRSCR